VHDAESGDHVEMLGQSGRGIKHLEPDDMRDTGVVGVATLLVDAVRRDVVPDERAAGGTPPPE
jgi:hypothetical protein